MIEMPLQVCDKASGCFRCPKNNCFVKWTPTEGRIGFEVEARGEFVDENAYVAIGLSEDNSMVATHCLHLLLLFLSL